MKINNKDFKTRNNNLEFEEFDSTTEAVEVEKGDVLNKLVFVDTNYGRRIRKVCTLNSKYYFSVEVDGIPSPHAIRFYPKAEFKEFIDKKLSSI